MRSQRIPMFELATIEVTLAAQEAEVPHLCKGCEKRIIWAQAPAAKTTYCVLYIHGFSATGEELRPLPDMIAQGLGANIYFTCLTGHGQNGDAMTLQVLRRGAGMCPRPWRWPKPSGKK